MKKHISFGSIGQFGTVAKDIGHRARYSGTDSEGNLIYSNVDLPILKAVGSEKIHGTNLTIAYNDVDGIWYQSRSSIITPQHDNAGSAFFCEARKDILINIIKMLAKEHNVDLSKDTLVLCGEFCGGSIQKNSAVSSLDKRIILFQHFKVATDCEDDNYWLETKVDNKWISSDQDLIFNIMNFKTYELEIDFNYPKLFNNKMIELLDSIEKNSPVGNYFGVENNIAEGIVFTVLFKDVVYKWKVKGEAHSKSKVKKLNTVDNEKEQLKIDVSNEVTPAWRLEQMYDLANDVINSGKPDIKNIGTFMRLLINDVIKEEIGLLTKNSLEIKDISKHISAIARRWYLEQLNSSLENSNN